MLEICISSISTSTITQNQQFSFSSPLITTIPPTHHAHMLFHALASQPPPSQSSTNGQSPSLLPTLHHLSPILQTKAHQPASPINLHIPSSSVPKNTPQAIIHTKSDPQLFHLPLRRLAYDSPLHRYLPSGSLSLMVDICDCIFDFSNTPPQEGILTLAPSCVTLRCIFSSEWWCDWWSDVAGFDYRIDSLVTLVLHFRTLGRSQM